MLTVPGLCQVAVGQQEEEARQRELEDLRGEVEALKQAQVRGPEAGTA